MIAARKLCQRVFFLLNEVTLWPITCGQCKVAETSWRGVAYYFK
nr:MAG TPA: hypothetical protein [Caudoviricetes sp.]